jgi:hypothetical protein
LSPAILEAAATVSSAFNTPGHNLIALAEKLASVRYLTILTSRWAASDSIGHERRKLMNRDLVLLRREYSTLIDDIAMNFGITAAMEAQENVERTVVVPKGIRPPEHRVVEEGFTI